MSILSTGIDIGRKEGLKQGLQQGLKEGRKTGEILGMIRMGKELNLPDSDIIKRLCKAFDLNHNAAMKLLRNFSDND